jgi:hypothetical protein
MPQIQGKPLSEESCNNGNPLCRRNVLPDSMQLYILITKRHPATVARLTFGLGQDHDRGCNQAGVDTQGDTSKRIKLALLSPIPEAPLAIDVAHGQAAIQTD